MLFLFVKGYTIEGPSLNYVASIAEIFPANDSGSIRSTGRELIKGVNRMFPSPLCSIRALFVSNIVLIH